MEKIMHHLGCPKNLGIKLNPKWWKWCRICSISIFSFGVKKIWLSSSWESEFFPSWIELHRLSILPPKQRSWPQGPLIMHFSICLGELPQSCPWFFQLPWDIMGCHHIRLVLKVICYIMFESGVKKPLIKDTPGIIVNHGSSCTLSPVPKTSKILPRQMEHGPRWTLHHSS